MIVVGEAEEEAPSLSGASAEVVGALRTQARRLRERLSESDDASLEKRLIGVGNTTAKVLESARKLRADAVGAMEGLTFEEKAALFVEWFSTLPPQYRDALRFKLDQFEAQLAEPLPAETGAN